MSISVNDWLKTKINYEDDDIVRVEHIICKDGFKLSVQASKFHYCEPRENHAPYYTKVEVGFPSGIPEYIMDYVEDIENPTNTVYAYVPTVYVEKLIDFHGGIKDE